MDGSRDANVGVGEGIVGGRTMTRRLRIDRLLVERGLFESRARAQQAIAAGGVFADGLQVSKPGQLIATDAAIEAQPAHPWVSRGGVKLAAALARFGIDPAGRTCLDVGASTGGFTDVLLQHGARHVYALDVGRDQLHPSLRQRPDVTFLEATDIRDFAHERLPERPSLVTIDVSFISLRHVLPAALALAAPLAQAIVLVKPQFEVGPEHLKKGLVRDPAMHRQACDAAAAAVRSCGWTMLGLMPSPIAGGDGNREFLLAAHG